MTRRSSILLLVAIAPVIFTRRGANRTSRRALRHQRPGLAGGTLRCAGVRLAARSARGRWGVQRPRTTGRCRLHGLRLGRLFGYTRAASGSVVVRVRRVWREVVACGLAQHRSPIRHVHYASHRRLRPRPRGPNTPSAAVCRRLCHPRPPPSRFRRRRNDHPRGHPDPCAPTELALSARPNKRLKLVARVDCGMNLSSARRSLSAIR